nr:uncharacterized protein LOC112491470 [Ziziphus jujuba var. spinosa]
MFVTPDWAGQDKTQSQSGVWKVKMGGGQVCPVDHVIPKEGDKSDPSGDWVTFVPPSSLRSISGRPLRSIVDLASPSPSKHLAGGRSLILEANYPSKHFWPVNTKVRFKEELPPLEEEVGPNEEYADSAAGFDGSSNTSGSLYAEKHDTSSSHEIESLKSTTSGDLVGLSLSQSSPPEKQDPSDHRFLPQGTAEWAHWGSDYSADNDLANAYEENGRLRGSLEAAESSIVELKLEVSSLQNHADEIGVEAKKVSQLLAEEIASGEKLAKEVSVLRSECLKFKDDLQQLKISKLSTPFAIRETIKIYILMSYLLKVQLHKESKYITICVEEVETKPSAKEHKNLTMNLDKTSVTLMGTLLALIEIKYQGKNVTPFDTHSTTMLIFSAIFVFYGILLIADGLQLVQLVDHAEIMSKVKFYSGSLALIMLLLIVVPYLGWFVLVLWIACLVKVVIEAVWPIALLAGESVIRRWSQIKTVFLGENVD